MADPLPQPDPRKLTHEQARAEQRLYWAQKSIPRRLPASPAVSSSSEASISLNRKQISLLAAFLAARVDFAVVGGVAVNARGSLRATHDLDPFIRPTQDNARNRVNPQPLCKTPEARTTPAQNRQK